MEALTTKPKDSLPGYKIDSLLYKSSRSLYFIGHDLDQHRKVIIRFLKKKQLSSADISRFKNEYELIQQLSDIDGIPCPLQMEITAYGPAMILKYFDGSLLADTVQKTCPDSAPEDVLSASGKNDLIEDFLSIAIPLTNLIGKLHSAGVIHQQIQPENIIWNAKTGRVTIIDFSNAKRYTRRQKKTGIKNISSGNLSYIAPEQTGRINRSIDFRTDFYSLGVTFYQMLTGSLPFKTDDAMQMVHAHIAKTPEAPDRINPDIPAVISEITLKLMAKNPEDRYQSAYGLLADLKKCREQLQTKIIDFEIGQADIADKLKIPQKIYGRAPEIKKLLSAFERTARGNLGALLLTGGSGIGKSRLVEELYLPVRNKNGFFVSSEFDRLKQDIPYAPLMQAFRDLIRQILTMEETVILRWKEALLEELGEDCRAIAGVIPEMESITGLQPADPELSTLASKKTFHLIFNRFITLFAAADHPLVIFLDNLQWADNASLLFMENMLKASQLKHCLLIGAYRESDIQKSRPQHFLTDALKSMSIHWDLIHMAPLDPEPVNQLVADTLSVSPDTTLELSKFVRKKTGGNPFFVFQFIKTLYEKRHIAFDGTWQFNLPAIAQADITENLADFMAIHLQGLSNNVLKILQTAACIGVHFNPDLIARVADKSYAEVTKTIAQAIHEGLLVSTDEGIKFVHDRVRDAAYMLMHEETRNKYHQRIGHALLLQKNKKQIAQNIFEIVYHLSQAVDRTIDIPGRISLAGYNLTAALKAKAAGAYQPARRYLLQAISLLPEYPWHDDYDLTLTLYNEICEIAYLTGDHNNADKYYSTILKHAKSPFDKVRAYEIKIIMFTGSNQPADAISLGIEALNLLGMSLPKKASKLGIAIGLVNAKWLLRNKTKEDLINLPEITDSKKLAIARILMRMTDPSYVENPDFLVIAVLKLLSLTVKYGNSSYSAFAYATYGAILCGVFGSYEKGREYADLALNALDKFNAVQLKAKVNILIGGGINHWTKPLKEDLVYLIKSYNSGVETGDHSFAAYGLTCYMYTSFFLGEPLEQVAEKFNKYYGPLKNLHQESSFQEYLLWHQLVENLKTVPDNPTKIKGRICNEEDFIPHWQQSNDLNRLGIHNIGKMVLYYLFDDMDACLKCAQDGKKYLEAIMGQIFVSEYYFYYSLALVAACPGAVTRIRKNHIKKIKSNQKKIGRWARHVPENFEHKYLLIEASRAALENEFEKAMILFNSSIAKAARNGFLQDEAIANEIAGKIWYALGNIEIADIFMTRAYRCYQRWGASSKIRLMEKRHPQLLSAVKEPFPAEWGKQIPDREASETDRTKPSAIDISSLDAATVIQAAQTVSEEIVLERLINQLVRLNIETAGAEKGALLLKSNDRFIVEAVGRSKKDGIEVTHPRGPASGIVPVSLIRFVGRTGETILLSDASKEKLFSRDPYIIRKSPKSVICIPVAHQHHLTAVMYMENNLAEGVFTPKHQAILKVIASQAAISIDNAVLYEELKDTEQRISHLLKTANEGVLSIDLNAVITDVNPEMCRILGRKRDTVIGMNYYDFLDIQGTEMVKGQLKLRLQGKKGAYDIVFTRPEGSRVDCLVKAAPLFDKSNKIIGSFAMVTDITERKRAEAELMTLNRELEQRVGKRTAELEESLETLKKAQDHLIQSEKMAALGGLVAGVTHEISTPIGIGVTANSFLEEKLATLNKLYQSQSLSAEDFEKNLKDAMEASATIKSNLKRAVELVGSFKEIAVDQSSEEKRRFNVKNYLDEVMMSLQPKFKRTRHEIITLCPEDLEINSYPGVFSQIITNLIVNSLTHAFENIEAGEMEIRVTVKNDHLVVGYQDNGCGMPPEAAAKIFDPFFTTRRSSGGSGLGMYIVYNIVTQTLGGQIECVSRQNEGMNITIQIPMENLG
ncbi:MAG: AAA family ATPase [Desulfobacteraceae bacterium]|nr:AAA family ATPase [Desulfobacteraceae bacterium]MBC2754085.1 AAA family ATPase [Desulfobacteraceae bacterium]